MSIRVNGKKILRIVRNGVYYTALRLGSASFWETIYSVLYYGSSASEPTSRYVSCSSLTVGSACRLEISGGGIADSTSVNQSGTLIVSSGGTTNSTTVNPGGRMNVSSGATAASILENGGYVWVAGGANYVTFETNTISGLVLNGAATVHAGTTANSTTIISSGTLQVSSGGTANSITVSSGGILYVSNGGIVNDTKIIGSEAMKGSMFVSNGGTANRTTVNYCGELYVSSGGTANLTTVYSSGSLYVSSGGTANSTTVNQIGSMCVFGGGTADSITVNSGGWMNVSSGATAASILENGGYVWVAEDAKHVTFATNAISGLVLNGSATVHAGTTANSTTVNWGIMRVYSGGTANSTTVNFRGDLYVYSGGRATIIYNPWHGTVVFSAGASVEYLERDANIYYGHQEDGILLKSDTISGFTIESGKSAIVYSGGTATSTTVSASYLYIMSGGIAEEIIITPVGRLRVSSGGTATNIVASGNARFGITVAPNTYVQGTSNGSTILMENATISGYAINYYDGYLRVLSGGTAVSTTVNRGCLYVESGGKATITFNPWQGTVVSSAGASVEYLERDANVYCGGGDSGLISKGDAVSDFIVEEGNSAIVYSGGTADSTTVNRSGYLNVFTGGTANRPTVKFGGHLYVYSGGTALNVVSHAGATISASEGAVVTFA